MDPFSIIIGTMTLVEAASTAYNTIQKIKNTPKAFKEVGESLPTVKQTLSEALAFYNSTTDTALQTDVLPITERCKENVGDLKAIFEKVASYNKDETDGNTWEVVVKKYCSALLTWGSTLAKSRKVEILMRDILKDVDLLSQHRLFQTATFTQVAGIQDAIERLSQIEPSISDSELEVPTQSNIQNIATGGRGMQNNNYGDNQQANFGSGHQFNISGNGHHYYGATGEKK